MTFSELNAWEARLTRTIAITLMLVAFGCGDDDDAPVDDASTDGSTVDSGSGEGGTDGSSACPGSQRLCGDECATLASDPAHCGSCDNACLAGQACAAGTCVA